MLEIKLQNHVDSLIERYPALESVRHSVMESYMMLEECYMHGGKLLVAGNGGSAADSEHIAGELMKTGFNFSKIIEDRSVMNLHKNWKMQIR